MKKLLKLLLLIFNRAPYLLRGLSCSLILFPLRDLIIICISGEPIFSSFYKNTKLHYQLALCALVAEAQMIKEIFKYLYLNFNAKMVGQAWFEHATPRSSAVRSPGLSYCPIKSDKELFYLKFKLNVKLLSNPL